MFLNKYFKIASEQIQIVTFYNHNSGRKLILHSFLIVTYFF